MDAKISGQDRHWETRAVLPQVATDNPELERLWAMARIDQDMEQIRENGETENLRRQVTDLGLNYSLVTDYTSMLVVTDDVREEAGIEAKNADRVRKERAAQQARATQPVQNHRIAAAENNGAGSFDT